MDLLVILLKQFSNPVVINEVGHQHQSHYQNEVKPLIHFIEHLQVMPQKVLYKALPNLIQILTQNFMDRYSFLNTVRYKQTGLGHTFRILNAKLPQVMVHMLPGCNTPFPVG